MQTWLPRESYPRILLLATSQSVHLSAVNEQVVQLEWQGWHESEPSAATTWKNPVLHTHIPLDRDRLFSVKHEVQLLADPEQVLHKAEQVTQTATPASKVPSIQLQLLLKTLVVLSEQVKHTLLSTHVAHLAGQATQRVEFWKNPDKH